MRYLGLAGPFTGSGNPADGQFYVHPHYRAQRPLDATLLKSEAGLDEFITEKYADQIGGILGRWSAGLIESPHNLKAIEEMLTPDFSGEGFTARESRLVRPGAVEVRQVQFSQAILGKDAFLNDFREATRGFSKILTAEFQITAIDASRPSLLQTVVRYEVAGTGPDFHREQRAGSWELAWDVTPAGEFRLRNWKHSDETRSRSARPIFAEVTTAALGGNSSYSAQLLHGSDYWRTVLDGACGIDIYGHNGVSAGDIDNDGFDDLYVCQPAGLPNRLYRNRGDGTFEDITEASGTGVLENTACALFADVNNDGRQELIVVRTNGPLLFLNDGGGKFRAKPDAFQFDNPPQGTFTGAAIADYDRDGWLDIYFCLYTYYQGTDQYKYPTPYYDANNGPPNFLMRNNRDGTFRDVTEESHLDENNTRYSFCCGWNDYNHDGWPDLYVVNDFGRKNLYRNNGGVFTDVAAQAGVEDVGAGMGVCWFDFDNDGNEDLYVADMWTAAGERVSRQEIFKKDAPKDIRALYQKHAMGNSLFRNAGETFHDATKGAGVGMGGWAWSSDAWDFDHDGFADVYIANGMVSGPSGVEPSADLNSFFWRQVVAKSPNEAKPSHDYEMGWTAINELIRSDGTWSGFERNVFYANNRDGTFSDVSSVVGLDFREDGRSFALADFDHDGRQEVFLKNRNGPQLRMLQNVMDILPPSISFRLRGTKSNRDAIGTVITLETEAGRQTRSLQAGSGFLSQHSKELFFGMGEAKGPVRATIRWPSGLSQELRNLPIDHRISVEEGSDAIRTEPFHKPALPRGASQLRSEDIGHSETEARESENLPTTAETWLLAPVAAPDFSLPDLTGQMRTLTALRGKPVLLNFCAAGDASSQEDLKTLSQRYSRWASEGLHVLSVNVDESGGKGDFPIVRATDDVSGIYNILYRYLFDRHRDLSLPTSFLIDEKGDIVKVYQGRLDPEHVEEDFHQIPRSKTQRLAKALPFSGVTDAVEFPRNYLSYGSVFFQRGYYEQAGEWFRRALHDDPFSAEATYGVGSVYLESNKNAEARESFARTVKLQASYPDTLPNAWNNLGLLATREGHNEEAIQYFQKALELNPDHRIALVNLGSAYRQAKQWQEARKTLEHAVAITPDDAEANYGLAMALAQLEDSDRAYYYLKRALTLRPGYPEALNNLGVLYLRTQRRDQAVASFEECIRLHPAFDQSYLNLARVYGVEGSPNKARAVLLELLKQHPDHAQARQMLQDLPQQ